MVNSKLPYCGKIRRDNSLFSLRTLERYFSRTLIKRSIHFRDLNFCHFQDSINSLCLAHCNLWIFYYLLLYHHHFSVIETKTRTKSCRTFYVFSLLLDRTWGSTLVLKLFIWKFPFFIRINFLYYKLNYPSIRVYLRMMPPFHCWAATFSTPAREPPTPLSLPQTGSTALPTLCTKPKGSGIENATAISFRASRDGPSSLWQCLLKQKEIKGNVTGDLGAL